MPEPLNLDQTAQLDAMLERARAAMAQIEDFSEDQLDTARPSHWLVRQ